MVCIFLLLFKISDFSLFFMQQLWFLPPTAQKSHPLFSSNLPLKIEILPCPLFWKFGRRLNPPGERGCTVSRSLFKKMVNIFLRSYLTFFSTSRHIKSHEENLYLWWSQESMEAENWNVYYLTNWLVASSGRLARFSEPVCYIRVYVTYRSN